MTTVSHVLDGSQLKREAYAIHEIAGSILPLSKRTLLRLIASGDLPSVKVRGRRLVRRVDLEKYMASLTGGSL